MNTDILSTKVEKSEPYSITISFFQDIKSPQNIIDKLSQLQFEVETIYGVTNGLLNDSIETTYDNDLRNTLQDQKNIYTNMDINFNKSVIGKTYKVDESTIEEILNQVHITQEQKEKYVTMREVELLDKFELYKFKDESLYIISMSFRKFMIIQVDDSQILKEITDPNHLFKKIQEYFGYQDERKAIQHAFLLLKQSNLLTESSINIIKEKEQKIKQRLQEADQRLVIPLKDKLILESQLKYFNNQELLNGPAFLQETVSFDWDNIKPIINKQS